MAEYILEAGGTMAFTFHVLFMLFNLFIIYQFYFNDKFYAGTDSICCHSHLTYTMIKENRTHAEKTFYIPHAIPPELFKPIPEEAKTQAKEAIFGKERAAVARSL